MSFVAVDPVDTRDPITIATLNGIIDNQTFFNDNLGGGGAVVLTNNSGVNLLEGAVVIFDQSADDSFVMTLIEGDERVLGALDEDINNGASGAVLMYGGPRLVDVDGSVGLGEWIMTGSTSGVGTGTGSNFWKNGSFALATEAIVGSGQVNAILLAKPKKGAQPSAGYTAFGSPITDGSIEEYIPDTWTSKTNGPAPAEREEGYMAGMDGYVYHYGGQDAAKTTSHSDLDEYVVDTWAAKTDAGNPSAEPQYRGIGIANNNELWIMGGRRGGSNEDAMISWDGRVGDTWTAEGAHPSALFNHPAQQHASISGKDYHGLWSGVVWYELSAGAFTLMTNKPSPNTARSSLITLNSKGFAMGGSGAVDNDEYVVDSWTGRTDVVAPAREDGAAFSLDAAGYLAYGDSTGAIADCDEYTDPADSWANKTDGPAASRDEVAGAEI